MATITQSLQSAQRDVQNAQDHVHEVVKELMALDRLSEADDAALVNTVLRQAESLLFDLRERV